MIIACVFVFVYFSIYQPSFPALKSEWLVKIIMSCEFVKFQIVMSGQFRTFCDDLNPPQKFIAEGRCMMGEYQGWAIILGKATIMQSLIDQSQDCIPTQSSFLMDYGLRPKNRNIETKTIMWNIFYRPCNNVLQKTRHQVAHFHLRDLLWSWNIMLSNAIWLKEFEF